MLNETIKKLEAKGYIVTASENRWKGVLDESCPTVYEILKPDYSKVYGANGLAPEGLDKWLDLPDLTAPKTKAAPKSWDAKKEAERKINERNYDNLYNEGAEGYNPHRA